MKAKKDFDCLEMKREIQEKMYEQTKDMTPKQEQEFIRKSVESGSFKEL